MKAEWPGTCLICTRPIEVGDEIHWERNLGAAHAACDEPGSRSADRDDEDIGVLPSERRRGRPERRDW